jgi:hypothetical protein
VCECVVGLLCLSVWLVQANMLALYQWVMGRYSTLDDDDGDDHGYDDGDVKGTFDYRSFGLTSPIQPS